MTERTSREHAEAIRAMSTERFTGYQNAVERLARDYIALLRDYIALLEENRILARAIQDIAFGNLSPEENERIASDAWYTAARAAIERTTEQE